MGKTIILLSIMAALLLLPVGTLNPPACAESPIVVTPSEWYTGLMENGTSKTASFLIQNQGSAPLLIKEVRLRTQSSGCFAITSPGKLPAILGPSGQMSVEVTFSAAGEGLHKASLEVEYTESMKADGP